MKYTTFSKAAFFVSAILIAAACAQSADIPGDPVVSDQQQTAPSDNAKLPPPSNSSKPVAAPPTPPAKVCASTCKTDYDCASTCPTTNGTACCDVATSTCFNSTTSCPKDQDSGTPPPAY